LIAGRLSSPRWQTGSLRQSLVLQRLADFVVGAIGDIAESLHQPQSKENVRVHAYGNRRIAPLDLDHRDMRRQGSLSQQVKRDTAPLSGVAYVSAQLAKCALDREWLRRCRLSHKISFSINYVRLKYTLVS